MILLNIEKHLNLLRSRINRDRDGAMGSVEKDSYWTEIGFWIAMKAVDVAQVFSVLPMLDLRPQLMFLRMLAGGEQVVLERVGFYYILERVLATNCPLLQVVKYILNHHF